MSLKWTKASLFVFAISSGSLADAKTIPFIPIPTNLSYTTENRDRLNDVEVKEVSGLARELIAQGLREVSAEAGDGHGILGVDQIFWNPIKSQAVFLKLDVSVSSHLQEKFLTDKDSYLYHSKTPSGLNFALYFLNFSPDDARNILEAKQIFFNQKKFSAYNPISPSKWLYNKLVPCAFAGESGHIKPKPGSRSEENAEEKSQPQSIAQNIITCSKGLGSGVYDSTIGLAQKAGSGAIKVVKATGNAIAHPAQAWRKIAEGFKSFIAFIAQGFGLLKYDVGIGRKDDKLKGIEEGLNNKSDSRPKVDPSSIKVPDKEPSAYSKLSQPEKLRFICDLVAKVGIAGATWIFAPSNAAGLSQHVGAFLNTGIQLATFEAGRQLFMEVQYAEKAKELGQKRKAMSQSQIELSRKWARENPEEAAKILRHYKESSPL
jgi:hypothetical protein